MSYTERRLAEFQGIGYQKGAGRLRQGLWALISGYVFEQVWCPARLRVRILRAFGASIGEGVIIRHRVRIHWPWKLTVGNNSWIGVDAWLLNLEPINIGSDVCISQGALLCTGSHQADCRTFEFDNAPISVGDGTWIAARVTVLRGVAIGRGAVVGATTLVVKDIPEGARVLAPRAEIRKRS